MSSPTAKRSFRQLEHAWVGKKLTSAELGPTAWSHSPEVPLSAEAYWNATRAGSQDIDLDERQHWSQAYKELIRDIVSEKREVFGRRDGTGISEKIPSHVFSDLRICYPFEDPSDVVTGQALYLLCWFTNEDVQGEHWQNGMNDQIVGPGSVIHWSHLKIKSVRYAEPQSKCDAPNDKTIAAVAENARRPLIKGLTKGCRLVETAERALWGDDGWPGDDGVATRDDKIRSWLKANGKRLVSDRTIQRYYSEKRKSLAG